MLMVFGVMVYSCDDGNGNSGNTDPKTLIITGMTPELIAEASDGGFIGIYPVGTSDANVTTDNLAYLAGGSTQYAVAGFDFDYIVELGGTLVGGTLTAPLVLPQSTARWTGSGTFDIYNAVCDGVKHRVYKAANISIISATTTITSSKYSKIYEENCDCD